MYTSRSTLANRTSLPTARPCSEPPAGIASPAMTKRGTPPTHGIHRATQAGTRRYRDRFSAWFAEDFYRPLAGSLTVSSLGIGTYLGVCDDSDDARYCAAIRSAFGQGLNVIDSAINYRCQRSERAAGIALREAIAASEISRDEVIVCTKGGYVPLEGSPPSTREEYLAYLQETFL